MENKPLFNFLNGINRKTAPLLLRDEECELAINYHFDKVGAITKRKGYSEANPAPVANADIRGLFASKVTNDWLAAGNNAAIGATNSVLYYNPFSTLSGWSSGKTDDDDLLDNSIDVYERVYFADFVDLVFRTNGNDAMASSATGSSWGTTNCLLNESPCFVTVFQDRVYAARDNSPGKLSRVWYSTLPDASMDVSWDETADGQWFDVNPDDGDDITGLENNGNRLLIFKSRALYRWTWGQTEPDRLIGVGAVNQAVIKTNFDVGITFFANPLGVYAYSGNRPKQISRKIQDIIDVVDDDAWRESCAGIDNDHYYLSVGDITVDGRTIENAVLVYTISLDCWTVYSFNVKPTIFASVPAESSDYKYELWFGAEDGGTYKMNDGYDDDGNSIATYFRSKEYMLSFPTVAEIDGLDVVAGIQGSTQVYIDTDRQDELYGFGNLEGRVTNFDAPRLRKANTMRFYFTDNSTTEAQIDGVNIRYTPTSRKDAVRKTKNYEDR